MMVAFEEPPMFACSGGGFGPVGAVGAVGAVGLLPPHPLPHAINGAIAIAIASHVILSIWTS